LVTQVLRYIKPTAQTEAILRSVEGVLLALMERVLLAARLAHLPVAAEVVLVEILLLFLPLAAVLAVTVKN
jgi:hypothetical protein